MTKKTVIVPPAPVKQVRGWLKILELVSKSFSGLMEMLKRR